ncbi:MAG: carbohydrate kinase family protein [Runella sp.]
MMIRKYALVATGELLADLIGTEFTDSLFDTELFRRLQGGSPANLAANMARLGNATALVACVGQDNLGKFLVAKVAETGVDTQYIQQNDVKPSSIVLVSRTKGTPDFIAYRAADCQIQCSYFPDDLLKNTSFFHTTCFALSQSPARESILEAASRAVGFGAIVSLDANYAPSLWPDRLEALEVVKNYCQRQAFVKLSEDDAERLLGEIKPPQEIIDTFHDMGAKLVCLTLGGKGSIVSADGEQITCPVKPIEIKDATGAGDAFWAGFLTAWLDQKSLGECAQAGANMAALKISTVGGLPPKIEKIAIYV